MIIDFKSRKPELSDGGRHDLVRAKPDYSKPFCDHNLIELNDSEKTVSCRKCKKELEPFEALMRLANDLWWTKHVEEEKVDIEEKRVRKVQKAAVEALMGWGITPERYAAMCEKVRETKKVEELKPKSNLIQTYRVEGKEPA